MPNPVVAAGLRRAMAIEQAECSLRALGVAADEAERMVSEVVRSEIDRASRTPHPADVQGAMARLVGRVVSGIGREAESE